MSAEEVARLDALSEAARLYPYWKIAQFHQNRRSNNSRWSEFASEIVELAVRQA